MVEPGDTIEIESGEYYVDIFTEVSYWIALRDY